VLCRLGARVLFYGPLNTVLHPDIVGNWLERILPFKPSHESERAQWAFCLAQLARQSGQRALDLDESHRQAVLDVLHTLPVPADWARLVEEYHGRELDEQARMFGEGLPIGLRVASSR
jgi:hypothetical protein